MTDSTGPTVHVARIDSGTKQWMHDAARTAKDRYPGAVGELPIRGRPLCLKCYDHPHQAVWNLQSGELWRRTMVTANRALGRLEEQ